MGGKIQSSAVDYSIMSSQTKSLLNKCKELNLKNFPSNWEKSCRCNRRLNWNAWFLQMNLISNRQTWFQLFWIQNLQWSSVWGVRVEKPAVWAIVFQVLSTIQGKTMAKPFYAFLLKGYTKCTIVLKNLLFEIFLTIHGKTMAKPFLSLLLQGYTRAIIMPIHQAQGPSMWLSPGPGPNSNLSPSTPKQWKPKCSYQELNLKPCCS